MRKTKTIFLLLILHLAARSNSVFTVDTMTYTVNLDIKKNAYLQQLPADILKGYISGRFHAYYPKREMNEILPDDFLAHFGKANFQCGPDFCWEEYAGHPYLEELYAMFKHTFRYKEVVYYDAQHSIVKREILWIQLMYTDTDPYGAVHTINGPKFWMLELYKDAFIRIPNYNNRAKDWTLQQEFDSRHFVPNEVWDEHLKKKSSKMDDTNEN